MAPSIKKNTVYSVVKSASSVIFPLISFPYASRMLLADSLGKVNFSASIISYFTLIASLGIATYAVRECVKVRDDRARLEQVGNQIFTINVLSMVFSYVLLAFTIVFTESLAEYRELLILQSLAIAATALGADWVNTAMEDFKFIALRTIVFQATSLILLLLFVHSPNDYIAYACITVFSSAGANLANIVHRKKYCDLKLTCTIELGRHIRPIMLLFGIQISQVIFVNSDITILGFMCGNYEVGLYSLSVKIYTIINTMIASIAWVLIPKLSHWFVQKNYQEINQLLAYALIFIVTLGLPCVVGLVVFAPDIIVIFGGTGFLEAASSLRILAVALAASLISGLLTNMIMIPSGRENICFIASLISATLNIVLNMLFIPFFGFIAAAVTTAISEVIGIIVVLPFVEKEIKLFGLRKRFLGPVCGSAGIVFIAALASAFMDTSVTKTVCVFAGSTVVYGIALIAFKNEFAIEALCKLRSVLTRKV